MGLYFAEKCRSRGVIVNLGIILSGALSNEMTIHLVSASALTESKKKLISMIFLRFLSISSLELIIYPVNSDDLKN